MAESLGAGFQRGKAGLSSVAEVLPRKQGAGVQFPQPAPDMSQEIWPHSLSARISGFQSEEPRAALGGATLSMISSRSAVRKVNPAGPGVVSKTKRRATYGVRFVSLPHSASHAANLVLRGQALAG
jgi:hypothetical protein